MLGSLFIKKIIPFVAGVTFTALIALVVGVMFHRVQLDNALRYMGSVGTSLIIISFVYSIRKRKWISTGTPKRFLQFHEITAWIGGIIIIVHSGIRFSISIPWLANIAMVVALISGFVGKDILRASRQALSEKQKKLEREGKTDNQIETLIFWDAISVRAMAKWRLIHLKITIIFTLLAVLHITIALMFGK